ncbi:MAG TPA: glycosyltransferase [Solirubrobacteraceae bacterium]|jgi:tetratricopeptide (TPR) repeat protein|nr:glycosyltransferase [Solirubrobacteraceae bacterium]
MALRLTKTSLPQTETAAGVAQVEADNNPALALHRAETAAVQGYVNRSGAALRSGDLAGYLRVFDDAVEMENPQRQYQLRKLLLEQGLASLRGASEKRATETLLTMARGAIAALESDPAEPVLLNYAGVILYELWALDAARALFLAAKRLDPDLPHLERNLKELSNRGRSGSHKKIAFHPALADLTKRAKRVADRARPAQGMRLSLCMIVRDEEEMLPRSLEAIKDAVDEIIIVDTGSQDGTIEIAKSFGATVIEREWTGSFSDARNVSLDAATGDWFLYLDADEVLVIDDLQKLRELIKQTWREAFFLHETNFSGTEESGTAVVHSALRLLRNRPNYRFSGRLHEQVALHLPAYLPERIVQSPVRINHYGYLGVVREAKDKSRRNIDLLLAQQADGHTNAFFHYNLGSEYFTIGELDKALAEFQQSTRMIEEDGIAGHEYVPSLTVRNVKTLRAVGRNEEAIDRADIGLERFPGLTDLVYDKAMASISLGRVDDGITFLNQCIEMGDAPSKYTAMVGAGTFVPRITLSRLYLTQGKAAEAVELLSWSLENHPEHPGTIHPYATALISTGWNPDAVVAEFERVLGTMTATARFMLGGALFEQGHPTVAEAQFRAVLEKQPHSAAARAALVEALMYQRRYADAVKEAESVPEDATVAVIVLRSELFGRLLARDTSGAQAALDRAPRVGLPDGERALYESWLAEQLGAAAPPPPLAGLGLLSLMLESLLRVQDFENFEALLPLLARMPVVERERRELLAQIYYRRGFLRSAGREWMAVCEQQPDVRALIGLGHVALANGQTETAATFAAQALALESGNEDARKLLEATQLKLAAAEQKEAA